MARKVSFLNQLQEVNPDLISVDAGDLLFSVPQPDEQQRQHAQEKMALIIDAYNASGYDAVNLGINDLALGTEFVRQFVDHAEFPLLSANIVDENNDPLFTPYTIIQRSGRTVGIAGVTAANPFIEDIQVQDPVESAKKVLQQMKGKVDFTVLLASVYNPEANQLRDTDLGYDLIIRSHTPRLSRTLNASEHSLFVSTGTQGRVVQILEVQQHSPDAEVTDLSMEIQRLSFIESRLNEFEAQAGDESLESYYQDSDATLAFIQNMQEQYTSLQQQVEQTSNYAALRVQSLGDQIQDNEKFHNRVEQFLSSAEDNQ